MRLLTRTARTGLRTIATQQSTLPSEADVVVIGGGSIGCNTLYHLTKLGVKNAVLLERNKLTSGTTWHTAGLLWRVRPSEIDIQLVDRTRKLNTEILEAETGIHPGWSQNGGLLLAQTDMRLTEVKRAYAMARSAGIECQMVTPNEIHDLHPLLDTSTLKGGLYTPGDGLLDPSALMAALTKGAEMGGAKVFEHTIVEDITTVDNGYGQKKVQSIITNRGTIRTDAIVCAAGAWSPYIGKMVGVDVPLVPFKHCYVITENIPNITVVPNCRDPDGSVYLRLQGKAMEVGGFESGAIPVRGIPKEFAFSLFDFPWDSFAEIMEAGLRRMPCLEKVGIKTEICGPESFTPDHQPLFGEAVDVRGFFLGCGLNSQGMMYGGGMGQQLAQWVIKGRPEQHMFKVDIRRYSQKTIKDPKWVEDKSQEGVKGNYSLGFILDQPLAGRGMIKDPLYDELLAQGAVYEEKMGMERPAWFARDGLTTPLLPYDYYGRYGHKAHDPYPYFDRLRTGYTFDWPYNISVVSAECEAARNRAVLFNISSFGKFFITGPEAQAAADWVFSNDMRKEPGTVVYTCMLNKHGLVESDLTASVVEPGPATLQPQSDGLSYYVCAGGSSKLQAMTHVQNAIADRGINAKVVDFSDNLCILSLQGPRSREILQKLTNYNVESLPFSASAVFDVAGTICRILRLTFVGELGYEVHVPADKTLEVYRAIMAAGQEFGVENAGFRALSSLSLEKGYPVWGSDARHSETPAELGIGFTCKTKADIDFLGRNATVERSKAGIQKRLVFVALDEPVPMWQMEPIYLGDRPVGYTRRGDYAFSLKKSVAHAMLTPGCKVTSEFLNSNKFEVEVSGKRYGAQLYLRSPFDVKNNRVKGIYPNLADQPELLSATA